MVEAAEWSAAVSQDPPPARPDRSMAAAQVADRVAGLLLVLESESSPAVANAIENVLATPGGGPRRCCSLRPHRGYHASHVPSRH